MLKASEKLLKSDALGASLAFELVFSCWESWASQELCPGLVTVFCAAAAATKVTRPSWRDVLGPLLGQEEPGWGKEELALCASPVWHLEPLEWEPSPAVNSSSRAPQ